MLVLQVLSSSRRE